MTDRLIINLGGEDRILKFNNYSLIELGIILECDPADVISKVMELAEKKPIRALSFVTFSGMMGWFESQANYTHGVELKSVTNWIGDANKEQMMAVWNVFKNATGVPSASEEAIAEYNAALEKLNPDAEKKKK